MRLCRGANEVKGIAVGGRRLGGQCRSPTATHQLRTEPAENFRQALVAMKVSLNFIVRIGGMIALAALGAWVGLTLSNPVPTDMQIFATQLLTLAGAGLGLLVTPRLTIDPLRDLLRPM